MENKTDDIFRFIQNYWLGILPILLSVFILVVGKPRG